MKSSLHAKIMSLRPGEHYYTAQCTTKVKGLLDRRLVWFWWRLQCTNAQTQYHGLPASLLVLLPSQLAHKVLDCPEALLWRRTEAFTAPELFVSLRASQGERGMRSSGAATKSH